MPDLILCDMMMPPPNGLMVKNELSGYPKVKIYAPPSLFGHVIANQVDTPYKFNHENGEVKIRLTEFSHIQGDAHVRNIGD